MVAVLFVYMVVYLCLFDAVLVVANANGGGGGGSWW